MEKSKIFKIDKYGFYLFGYRFATPFYDGILKMIYGHFEKYNMATFKRIGEFCNFGVWKK